MPNQGVLQAVSIKQLYMEVLVCLFGLMLNIPVNSYGHVMTFSSPSHTFSLSKLD